MPLLGITASAAARYIIISFDPRDGTDNGLTVDRAQELGEQFYFLFSSKIVNSEFLFISFRIGYNTAIASASVQSSPQAIPPLEN